jgi:hypothetical protein
MRFSAARIEADDTRHARLYERAGFADASRMIHVRVDS